MAIPSWKHGGAIDVPVESYQSAISKASIIDTVPKGTLISRRKPKKKISKPWYEKSPIETLIDVGTFFPKVGYSLLTDDMDPLIDAVTTGAESMGAVTTFEEESVVFLETGEYETKTTTTYEEGPGPIPGVNIPDLPKIEFPKIDVFGGLRDLLGGLAKPVLLVGAAIIGGYVLLKKK